MMSAPQLLAVAIISAVLACPASAPARAQDSACGASEGTRDLQVRPQDRPQGVALDAVIQVRFPAGTDLDALLQSVADAADTDVCAGDVLCLFRDASASGASAREPVVGGIARLDPRTLAFRPADRLRPDTAYFLSIARPGFTRVSRAEYEFTTGSRRDEAPPELPADAELRLTIDAPPPECRAETGSLRVRLRVPRITDDADERSVEALLFLTRAAGLRGPTLRARAHNPEEGDVLLTLVLAPDEAHAPVCVVLRAVDGAGRVSEAEPELCFDPRQGSHFVSLCAARPPGGQAAHGAGDLIFSSALLLLAMHRVRRRRP
jgi:hypothetical protein